MKNTLVKLLVLFVVCASLMSFAGCNKAEENNSSIPTSSINSTLINSEEEIYDDYEYCRILSNGSCAEYNHKNVEEIIYKYFNLHRWLNFKPDEFLASLGIVKNFKYYNRDMVSVNNATLHKTNIKYSDYKEKMLTYMSQKHFNETIFSSKEIFTEKDGFLYTVVREYGDMYDEILPTVFFEKQEDGKYAYFVYCPLYDEEKADSYCWLKVSIIKENDIYVLDSCKAIDRMDIEFKGYDTLTDETAMAITYNRYNLLRKYKGSADSFLGALNIVDKVKFYDEKIVVSEECVLYKTNIVYKDFENEALKYISKKHLDTHFFGTKTFAEKDGYLYIRRERGVLYTIDILDIKFVREKNGKYIYRAKCVDNTDSDDPWKFSATITIIEQNGVYVFDSTVEI